MTAVKKRHGAELHWATHRKLSHYGAAFIVNEEGVRLHPYYDSRHLVTSGVGHLITPPHTHITPDDIHKWSFPSVAAAINYFRNHDVLVYERAVRNSLGKSMITQAEYDMCVSLCLNIGTGGFAGSTVARDIRAGKIVAAGNAFMNWAHPVELTGRRTRERARFLTGHW
jgi:lysozyme